MVVVINVDIVGVSELFLGKNKGKGEGREKIEIKYR